MRLYSLIFQKFSNLKQRNGNGIKTGNTQSLKFRRDQEPQFLYKTSNLRTLSSICYKIDKPLSVECYNPIHLLLILANRKIL